MSNNRTGTEIVDIFAGDNIPVPAETKAERKKRYNIKYYKKNKAKLNKAGREWYRDNKEKASKCGREYYQDNKENCKEKSKENKKNNREKLKEKSKEYRQREYVIQRTKDYRKERMKEPNYKLRDRIRCLFKSYFNSQGTSKQGKSCMTFVSYTIQELRDHLESLFTEGMTWDNYGLKGWVIDHVIPSIFFDAYDYTEIRMCWRLDNLRPMWNKKNVEKSDKMMLWGKEINAKNYSINRYDDNKEKKKE